MPISLNDFLAEKTEEFRKEVKNLGDKFIKEELQSNALDMLIILTDKNADAEEKRMARDTLEDMFD